jgi:hypothetical protein
LENQKPIIACSHLTEGELRQLHHRFGYSAADRLHKVLSRTSYNDVKKSVITKINKYCHQYQIHGSASNRFRFTIRDNANFNYRFIVDVIYIAKRPIFYAFDEITLFQAARFLANI